MNKTMDDVSLHYDVWGTDGPRVVLLHGWGCSGSTMAPVVRALEADHRVLSLDFPGHGSSDRPPEPWGVPEYSECLFSLLRQLDFLPCAVVAHSFGCRVACYLASEDSSLFTRMVWTGAAGLKALASEDSQRRSAQYQKEKALVASLEKLPGMKGVGQNLREKLVQKYGSADYKALDPEMRQTFNRIIGLDLRDRYAQIHCPVLLIWGEKDTATPLWMGQEMEKLIPDAGLILFEGCSHFAFLEQNGRFNTIIRSFL